MPEFLVRTTSFENGEAEALFLLCFAAQMNFAGYTVNLVPAIEKGETETFSFYVYDDLMSKEYGEAQFEIHEGSMTISVRQGPYDRNCIMAIARGLGIPEEKALDLSLFAVEREIENGIVLFVAMAPNTISVSE